MARFDGALARQFDFGGMTTTSSVPAGSGRRAGLRLASSGMRGADKYKELEHRRRQAQMAARRLLSLMDEREG